MINCALFLNILPTLAHAAVKSIIIAVGSTILGFCGGTIIALLEYQGNKIINFFIGVYLAIIRGTPMIVQIVFFYHVLSLPIDPLYIAILAIGINSAAYISQTIKTGIKSISVGEIEAARVMGFSTGDIMRYFILPQAFRAIFPSLSNEFVTLIKDSSLAYVIGVNELFKTGKSLQATHFDVLTIYLSVTCFYFVMTTSISLLLKYCEGRLEKEC